jgi:hypothetical protein
MVRDRGRNDEDLLPAALWDLRPYRTEPSTFIIDREHIARVGSEKTRWRAPRRVDGRHLTDVSIRGGPNDDEEVDDK